LTNEASYIRPMKGYLFALFVLAIVWIFVVPLQAGSSPHFWRVDSPNHGQTFAYGSERDRAWLALGDDHHLGFSIDFTNDPYVDIDNPRRCDSFVFSFPEVRLGNDKHTFYFHADDGRAIPVAVRRADFLGIDEIRLLPNALLEIREPHGHLSLSLLVQDHAQLTDYR
jgi:hypothetical protein